MTVVKALVKEVLRALLRVVPDAAVSRLVPRADRYDGRRLQPLPAKSDKKIRLFIGPMNSAGQAWQWARAVEKHIPGTSAVSMTASGKGDFAFEVDQRVPWGAYRWSSSWQGRQAQAIAAHFTHVIFESARPLFGDLFNRSFVEDLHCLRSRGLKAAILFHGSDIRLPSRHAVHSLWSPFRGDEPVLARILEARVTQTAERIRGLDFPIFVSTPDLLLDVPTAVWLPVVVDPEIWRTDRAPFVDHDVPIVAHAPTRAILKGSDVIDPILARLEGEGLLCYRRVEGISPEEMPRVYKDADIVIDQVRLGIYGVAACESMAAGRITVSHVSYQVRNHVLTATGMELPIVETNPDDLESTIRAIIANPAHYLATAAAGVAFVSSVHNGRLSAEKLKGFLTARSSRG